MTIKPHSFFLVVSLTFGLVFLILTPPFQVPDEVNHFYKAYQITDGHWLSEKKDHRLGGYVPKSFIKLAAPFLKLRWNMNAKADFETIRKQFLISLDENDSIFVDFPNTALYSPVSYLPQALAIFVLKMLKTPPLFIFYVARIFTLFIWIVSIWLVIKMSPVYKWLFTLLALLPMSVFINMSLSADVMTNIIAFLFLGSILKFTFEENPFRQRQFLLLVLLTILLASAKIAYTSLILLFLLIPSGKFKNQQKKYLYFAVLLVIGLITTLIWSEIINRLYIPYLNYNPLYRDNIDLIKCANIQRQMDFILSHGVYIFGVFLHSLSHTFDMYYQGYIGTFGWLDAKLPVWLITISYIVIFIVAALGNNPDKKFSNFQKTVLFFSLISIVALVLLSQHLTWDCVGGDLIATIQGRYFIPAFPLLFLLFSNRYNKYVQTKFIVMIFSVFLLLFSAKTIYARYYISPVFKNIKIRCDAEKLAGGAMFETSEPDIFLKNGNTQSSNKARSGRYSACLTAQSSFGFTYRIFKAARGDIIHIEVWRMGKSGGIVLSGESGKDFYFTSSKAVETGAKGWQKLQLDYTLQADMKENEIGIYLYNNKDTSYFDDFYILIQEQE